MTIPDPRVITLANLRRWARRHAAEGCTFWERGTGGCDCGWYSIEPDDWARRFHDRAERESFHFAVISPSASADLIYGQPIGESHPLTPPEPPPV